MNLLSDIITYIRRLIKSPSNAQVSDNLLIDYINRFWIMDVDARVQLFDLKTTYAFQTQPGVDRYNMPLYNIQTEPGSQNISFYPVYQGFLGPVYINGVNVQFSTEMKEFFNIYPNIVQNAPNLILGNGTSGPYTITFPIGQANTVPPITPIQSLIRGHVDISGIIATGVNQDPIFGTDINHNIPITSIQPAVYFTALDQFGNSMVVQDSGQFLLDGSANKQFNYGLLMQPGTTPFGYTGYTGAYSTTSNTINYLTGQAVVNFPSSVAAGTPINGQCYWFQTGLPRSILFYNNTITLRNPPSQQYLVELEAYLTPAAFLSTGAAVQFGYMSEYIARGAARKILSDTGDWEQFDRYESLFKEQELLVWKRSQRQWTSTRTQTIYSQGYNNGQYGGNFNGGNTI